MPTNADEAMKSDALGKRLGGNAVFVGYDSVTKGWAVFGTFSGFCYSTHGDDRKAADNARDELQRNAK